MEFDPRDQDIIRLLTKLRDVNPEYPENMLVARRQNFLKRMTEIELGVSGDSGVRNAAESIKPTSQSLTISTLLETALIVAIVAESGVMAYFYRDKLANFLRTFGAASRVEEVTPAPVIPTSLEIQGISASPAIPSTTGTVSPTGTIGISTGTPIPGVVGDNSSTPGVSSNSTLVPNGNNGNHYGQTPKPERTKENNGNNDKPPKDKPPKEKPTKSRGS